MFTRLLSSHPNLPLFACLFVYCPPCGEAAQLKNSHGMRISSGYCRAMASRRLPLHPFSSPWQPRIHRHQLAEQRVHLLAAATFIKVLVCVLARAKASWVPSSGAVAPQLAVMVRRLVRLGAATRRLSTVKSHCRETEQS